MDSQQQISRSASITFLTLPVELRLEIAERVLEQHPREGLPREAGVGKKALSSSVQYHPSDNLTLLRICQQLSLEFTPLAYNKTRFTLYGQTTECVSQMRKLPLQKLRNIRKLALGPSAMSDTGLEMCSWKHYVLNEERLRLDELAMYWMLEGASHINMRLVPLLRRLQHVKTIKLVVYERGTYAARRTPLDPRHAYRHLVGAIMKEDHAQRYDAPDAPNIEATWWDWSFDDKDSMITLQAKGPRPLLAEEDYMLLMKSHVDALMEEAERALGISS